MTKEKFKSNIKEIIENYVKEEAEKCNECIEVDYDIAATILIEVAREISIEKGISDPVEDILWNAFYKGLETIKKGDDQ